MSEMPVSKSQIRALRLLNLDTADSYAAAAATLETAGFSTDGIPADHTWRSAAKLSDAELLEQLNRSKLSANDDYETVPDGFGGVQ